MSDRRGVTLLEILLVIVILGLTFTLLNPLPALIGRLQLKRWSRHLASDLRLAQYRAICENSNHYIDLDIGKNSYTIYMLQEGAKKMIKHRQIEPPVKLEGVSINPSSFHFTPSGAPSRGNTITLAWQGRKALIYTRVGTGRVRIDYE